MANLIPKDKFAVYPCAADLGGTCFPSIGIQFQRADGSHGSAYRILEDHGTFSTLDDAMAVARTVKVESLDENGVVRFAPTKQ